MDDILVFLLKQGAHIKPIRITTAEIGCEVQMSQQNASRRLAELEKKGYLKRGKEGIKLSRKAYNEFADAYTMLKQVFERKRLEITGTITKGLEEGRYYLSMKGYKKQIKKLLGFVPYPGTLNVNIDEEELWKKRYLLQLEPVVIAGFRDRKRTYGDLYAYRCKLEGHSCALIVPLRTHHGPQILEVIGPYNIKKKLGKRDGDKVKVVVC
jgi:riboflavin kinase